MRQVLVVSRSVPHHGAGGMETVTWDLARQMGAWSDTKVTLLTTAIPGKTGVFVEGRIEVVSLNGTIPGRYSREWWRKSSEYFDSTFRTTTHVISVSAGAYGFVGSRRPGLGPPVILQAHGTSYGELLSNWRTGTPRDVARAARSLISLPRDLMTYRKFDSVVAVGKTVYRDLTSAPVRWFLPRRQVTLIPNGIDVRAFAPTPEARPTARRTLGLPGTAKVVLSVSRLHSQKGLDMAIRGFARYAMHDGTARFVIVGDGPDRPRLEGLVRDLDLQDRVVFAGAVPRAEVPRYLRAADAFLFTSTHREGLPLNVLEALAAGLPCLVSEHLADVVPEAGDAVRGVRTADPDDIALALGDVPWGREDRHSLLPPQYTLDHCAEQYLDLMDRLASERAAKAVLPTPRPPGQGRSQC